MNLPLFELFSVRVGAEPVRPFFYRLSAFLVVLAGIVTQAVFHSFMEGCECGMTQGFVVVVHEREQSLEYWRIIVEITQQRNSRGSRQCERCAATIVEGSLRFQRELAERQLRRFVAPVGKHAERVDGSLAHTRIFIVEQSDQSAHRSIAGENPFGTG